MLYIKAYCEVVLYREHNVRDFILFPDSVFPSICTDAVLNSEFARRIITDIEHIDVMSVPNVERALLERRMHADDISTGSKNLLLSKFYVNKQRILLTRMGENCHRYLFEVAKEKDVFIAATNYISMKNSDPAGTQVYFEDTDVVCRTSDELVEQMLELHCRRLWDEKDDKH